MTTVWGYGPVRTQGRGPLVFNAPSLTIEAKANTPVRIKWINELVNASGEFLPHLLTVDPTLHWANPPGGARGRDTRPTFDPDLHREVRAYIGPVPIVTHVHGAVGVGDESDGYAEAWYLPVARDIPTGYATEGARVWQVGNEGGFLAAPVDHMALGGTLLMGLAERADVIVDFTAVAPGDYVLGNLGPDEPFGGGVPKIDFEPADPATTGQVMQFRVVPAVAPDPTTPPEFLKLPAITALPPATVTRPLALIEKMGMGCDSDGSMIDGPVEAVLGRIVQGMDVADMWMDPVTENPAIGATEVWEFYNTTADAHPMHVHEVVFEVVNREGLVLDGMGDVLRPVQLDGVVAAPELWETGFEDTVIAYPAQVTRVRMRFTNPGQYVWHCHIVEHEDNEMMRPFRIGPEQLGQPMPPGMP